MSILDNVRIGKPDATDQEVLQALKDAPIILMYEATPQFCSITCLLVA